VDVADAKMSKMDNRPAARTTLETFHSAHVPAGFSGGTPVEYVLQSDHAV
jgi:hypothetical protein